jgi:amino-acid N-acetyltransferase
MTATIRPSTPADLGLVRDLLAASSLPVADVTPTAAIEFLVADEAALPVGAVGLERHAARHGVERLVLLTTTADAFFAGRGYAITERNTLPDDLLGSAEFRSLCPASARCLARRLPPPR